MKKILSNFCFLFLATGTLLTKNVSASTPTPSPSGPQWSDKMNEMSNTLTKLILNISSDERYRDVKNQPIIEAQIKTLASVSHSLKSPEISSAHPDPSIQIMASQLESNANDAYLAFHDGKREYARALVRAVTNSCIACHTMNSSGPHFPQLNADTIDLNPIERARFYTATRQFDSAISEYQKIISDKDVLNDNSSTWEEAVHQCINIAIRVKRDKSLAKSIIKLVVEQDGAPYYMRDDALEWKKSIESWNPKKLETESALYSEAKRLFAVAKSRQKFGSDHSTDILYIIASATLSDLLAISPNGPHTSEALLMEGICNESIGGPGYENLPAIFYEECIVKTPHSKIAQSCYHYYEQQNYLGYSGSAGVHLPEEVKKKNLRLQTLATPKT